MATGGVNKNSVAPFQGLILLQSPSLLLIRAGARVRSREAQEAVVLVTQSAYVGGQYHK